MSSGYSSIDGTTKTPEDQLRFSYLDGEMRTSGQDVVNPTGDDGSSKTGRNNDVMGRLESLQSTRDTEYTSVARK